MAQVSATLVEDRVREKAHQSLKSLFNEMVQTQSEELASSSTSEAPESQSDYTMLVCDTLVEQLGLIVQEARFARNATLPISCVPNELLHQIIALALPDTDRFEYHKVLLAYRLVCVTWRRFIDVAPAFWVVVSCMMASGTLDTALTRSRPLPLKIQCGYPYDPNDEDDETSRRCTGP